MIGKPNTPNTHYSNPFKALASREFNGEFLVKKQIEAISA